MFRQYMPLASRLLDVGVGDGFFAKVTFKRIDVGLDVKGSRMGQAEALGVYKKLVTYDGQKFPFKNHSFQTIVSNCVLEHVEAIDEVVHEIYRVLAPGGTALLTVMAKPWEVHLFGALFLGTTYKNYMRQKQVHLNLFSFEKWKQTFTNAGFRIKKAEGYLSPSACRLIDVCHYLSIPSLITYKLFGKWVLWPRLASSYPISWFAKILDEPVELANSGAIFFVLSKS